jgi:hypothetical protein
MDIAQGPAVAPATPPAHGQPGNAESMPGRPLKDSLTPKWLNFDKRENYEDAKKRILDVKTRNFVVEFGAENSRIAWDLDLEDVKQLLREKRDADSYPVRWMSV